MKQESKHQPMKDAEKEQWIDEVMNSLNGLNRAEPQPFLWTRVMSRAQKQKPVATSYMWLAAAGFAILIVLNILVFSTGKGKHPANPDGLAEQFQLNTPSTIDYN